MIRNVWSDRNESLPALTPEKVQEAEVKLGVKLPKSYIELCSIQNGGYLEYDAFPTLVPTSWADDHVSVDHIRGVNEDGILDNQYYIDEWGLPNHIVLLCGDGHSWVALDYRETKENPPIIYVDAEYTDEIFILELASDFESLINGLFIYEDNV